MEVENSAAALFGMCAKPVKYVPAAGDTAMSPRTLVAPVVVTPVLVRSAKPPAVPRSTGEINSDPSTMKRTVSIILLAVGSPVCLLCEPTHGDCDGGVLKR